MIASNLPTIYVISGATASGKSLFLQSFAKKIPIEVINVDSRQVYQYMSIGTASPTTLEQENIKHHLVGFLDPKEKYSSGLFIKQVKAIIPTILKQNKTPVISGGTFFYIKSLWDGLLDEPSISNEIIQKVNTLSSKEIKKQLQEADPIAYQNITTNNLQRMKRALIVILSSKKAFSSFKKEGGIYQNYNFKSYYLDLPRTILYEKINKRVDHMVEEGWLQEIQNLINMGYNLSHHGLQTIGYKEILTWYIENKKQDLNQVPSHVIENIKQKTRRYAKRQYTWFRNESRLTPINDTELFLSKL